MAGRNLPSLTCAFLRSFAPTSVSFRLGGWSLGKESFQVNPDEDNPILPARAFPPGRHPHADRARAVAIGAKASLAGLLASAALAGQALAQATPSAAGIGAQVQGMAQEGSTTGGYVGSMAMYVCALVCLIGGAWALWQSRQPQQREGGKVAMGLAGLVLCGLFAAGGTWINKAANTTSGANANITSTAGVVTFGGGG